MAILTLTSRRLRCDVPNCSQFLDLREGDNVPIQWRVLRPANFRAGDILTDSPAVERHICPLHRVQVEIDETAHRGTQWNI